MTNNTVEARLAKLKKQQQKLAEREQLLLKQSRERKLSKILTLIDNYDLSPIEVSYLLQRLRDKAGHQNHRRIDEDAVRIPQGIEYINPENPAQEWSGKGRPPNWLKHFVSIGKIDDCIKRSFS